MPKSFGSESIGIFLAIFVLLSDIFSKWVIVNSMIFGECRRIFPFLNVVMVKNTGVAFGLLGGVISPVVLMLISIVVMIFLIAWGRNNRNCLLPVSLIVGGAVGNILDRITRGAVVDFLDFHLFRYHWPAFNIADSSIVIGMFFLFFISCGEKS
jgi:signal peptidase II